jgi:hypothetical protein
MFLPMYVLECSLRGILRRFYKVYQIPDKNSLEKQGGCPKMSGASTLYDMPVSNNGAVR